MRNRFSTKFLCRDDIGSYRILSHSIASQCACDAMDCDGDGYGYGGCDAGCGGRCDAMDRWMDRWMDAVRDRCDIASYYVAMRCAELELTVGDACHFTVFTRTRPMVVGRPPTIHVWRKMSVCIRQIEALALLIPYFDPASIPKGLPMALKFSIGPKCTFFRSLCRYNSNRPLSWIYSTGYGIVSTTLRSPMRWMV